MVYLQNKDANSSNSFSLKVEDYKIRKGDMLFINSNTLDKYSSGFENNRNIIPNVVGDIGLFLNSYEVNDSGCINIPVIGKVLVAGSTLEEAKYILQEKINEYMNYVVVDIKLTNFKTTVLGEVKNPGTYNLLKNRKANLLDALGMAGDLTEYGNRKNIKIIRFDGNNSNIYKLDITDNSIIGSPLFYLQPNDVIYVEPLKTKTYGFRNAVVTSSALLSLISTLILIIKL
ncbi:MAG: hypothetical protein A2X12_11880 [Bacteroidetes bacterium GWE2_29_8]|nr:MAG: hypothetical protein A2X12_11880 [Bacteroidetes bacterium GWE2_29_8]OFY22170.1 MAG: hypothetical protein A2X02_00345 [Bacteroidetes bacterium GWF2_29_10]